MNVCFFRFLPKSKPFTFVICNAVTFYRCNMTRAQNAAQPQALHTTAAHLEKLFVLALMHWWKIRLMKLR